MSGGEGKGENKAPSAVNVPNALTVLRLVLVPVFLWLLLENTTGSRWWALAVFAIAAYTDHLDGEIARKHNIITNFGKLLIRWQISSSPWAPSLLCQSLAT